MQCGESELCLRLNPGGVRDAKTAGLSQCVREEGTLADARLAAENEDCAAAGSRVREDLVECLAFTASTTQRGYRVETGHRHRLIRA
jgi:hypothetical protein